jgi:GT2 family glycosyltransferase
LALVASEPDEVWIKSAVGSVLAQIYPHFKLSLCANGSGRPHVREVIEEYADTESRTTALSLPKRTSRAAAYNAALAGSTADYVALMDAGDELAPEALFEIVELLQGDSADVVYTDEDRVDVSGRRSHPMFKPYWSPELLLSTPYPGRLCVIRRDLFEAVGGLREGFDGAEEHDLMLRLSEWTDSIRHLPKILYRRRDLTTGPDADDRVSGRFAMPPVALTAKRAVTEALDRRTDVAAVEQDPVRKTLRVVRSPSRDTETSVIVFVPQGTLPPSLLGQLEREAYGPIREVIPAGVDHEMRPSLADEGSREVRHPFLARALNLAARRAEGEHLVFLDGRSELTDPGWLMELVGHTGRPDVGAVGCRLKRSRGDLYYGGSFVDLSRLTGRPEEVDFERREGRPLVDLPFNPLTVPIECLAVRRSVFEEVGGFDDENLPSAFYDLDLCLRLQEEGLRNVYTPYASVRCGDLRDANLRVAPGEAEVAYMWRRWWEQLVWLLHYRFSPLQPTPHAAYAEMLGLLGAPGTRRATH